jgi:hypothetical protein
LRRGREENFASRPFSSGRQSRQQEVARDASFDESASCMTHLTLYHGDSESVDAEVDGVSRVAVSGWMKADDAARSLMSPVDITVPAGFTSDHVVLMRALAGGTVRGCMPMAASSFGRQETYPVSSAIISVLAS